MNILIVGNILKDVYLNLDTRTETLESDKNGTKWLNLSFNNSEHRFFNRHPSLGGAAVSLEVLNKLGLTAHIIGSDLSLTDDNQYTKPNIYRYILVSEDDKVSYFVPSNTEPTIIDLSDNTTYDYVYIDRSAYLTPESINILITYLKSNPTKLALYLKTPLDQNLTALLPYANLIFIEKHHHFSEDSYALPSSVTPDKICFVSDSQLSYDNHKINLSLKRIDMLTHLSAFSILSATILGATILGKSKEEALKLAKLNLENSRLDSVLTLDELTNLDFATSQPDTLELIAASLVKKGILAADESGGSIKKKFAQLDIPDTFENRHDYRNIFFTTDDLEKYVSGVILFDETARDQMDDGTPIPDYLIAKCIIPGIKVDQGLEKFGDNFPPEYSTNTKVNPEETWTKGLVGLPNRLKEYYQMGLRFAKWRAAFEIRLDDSGHLITPTNAAIAANCQILAKYAKACQTAGLVPIVEPEVVYDGDYSIEQNSEVTAKILSCLFANLQSLKVNLKATILKVNMVLAGKKSGQDSTPKEVGIFTASVLKNHVPSSLAGVAFLSGGQTVEQATDNLAAIIKNGPFPWPVTFSFARALQDPALFTWAGDNEKADAARQAFLARLIANSNALK